MTEDAGVLGACYVRVELVLLFNCLKKLFSLFMILICAQLHVLLH